MVSRQFIAQFVFVLPQKVLLAQTRLNVLLRDINKALSIKTILQQLIFIV